MKKKMIFICGLFVVVVIAVGVGFWVKPIKREVQIEGQPIQGEIIELVGLVDTKEEAETLAEAYGITLVSYSESVAVFQTDKSYEEIVEIGKNKGLSELSRNDEMQLY